MVPPSLPHPGALVTVTGIAELAGAVGLLGPAVSRWAALGLAVLLVAMFPANIHAARGRVTLRGRPCASYTASARVDRVVVLGRSVAGTSAGIENGVGWCHRHGLTE